MPTYSVADIAQPASQTFSIADIAPEARSAPTAQLSGGSGQPDSGGDLPHPDLVDQQTTIHAQTLAGTLARIAQADAARTSQQMADQPPAMPVPPTPNGLQTDDQVRAGAAVWTNPRTGQRAKMLPPGQGGGPLNVLDSPLTGGARMGEGFDQMAEPGLRQKAGGLHKVIAGGFEAATPLMVGAGAVAPVATAATLAATTGAQAGTEAVLKKIGIPEEYAQVAGDLVGLFAAAKTPRTIEALRTKYEPILKARFAKANPPSGQPSGQDAALPGSVAPTTPSTTPSTSPPTRPPAQSFDAFMKERQSAQQPAVGADAGGGVTATVRTPAGTKARVRYRIDEAKDLTTSFDGGNYNAEFQPRNTDRLGSRQRVEQRKADMDPEAMGYSRMAGDGAPITSGKMAVTRNHGLQALKEIYSEGRPLARDYHNFVMENAGLAGKTPEEVAAMQHPVLHRELTERWDTGQIGKFVEEANASSTARMSDAEIAEQMARKLTGAGMDAFHPNDDGVPNPEFVRGLIKDLPVEEQAMFFDKNGEISQSGARLVRNAVFAKAYPNRAAIERMSESTDSNVRNITNGMLRSANDVAKMQEAIDRGDRHPLSISEDIGRAAGVIDDLRTSKRSVPDWLNQDQFDGRDPVLDELVRIFSNEGRRPKVIANTIQNYVDGIDRAGNPNQESMFAAEPPTKLQLLKEAYDSAKRTAEREADGRRREGPQGSLSVHRPGDGPEGPGPDGQGDRAGATAAGGSVGPAPAASVAGPSSLLDRLSAAGSESDRWLRENGITGGGSAGANRFLDPQVLFHLTRSIAGDVARGAISVGDAAKTILDRLRDKFEGVPAGPEIERLIRERIREEAEGREAGERGPVFREFRHDEVGATAALEKAQSGDSVGALQDRKFGHGDVDLVWGYRGDGSPEWKKGFGLAHVLAKHEWLRGHLQEMLDRMTKATPHGPERVDLSNEQGEHAVLALTWYGRENKTWLLTEYDPERPVPVRILDGSGSPVSGAGEPTSPPTGSSSSSLTGNAEGPASTGPTYVGGGLGAFEPFLRESIEDMKSLYAQREAALEELKRSEITPGEKHWGDRVRHYFTSERDLWAARANQGIAKARKLTFASRNRRTGVDQKAEAVTIAREFKGRTEELKSILGGFHRDLTSIEDPAVYKRVMDRIQALRPAIERALAKPDAEMQAVDQFYTDMARMTAAEGKRTGVLHSEWNPETYVPHVLHPKGEGQLPGLRKAIGSALGGKIGKHFGFAQERAYPTLLHSIMNDVIPKTMNVHDAFTIQQDHFARSRATRLLEDELRTANIGKYTVQGSAPEGWKPLAPHANEFRQLVPYATNAIDEAGQPVADVAEKRLYVPDFIAEGLKPITAPDFTVEIKGKDIMRATQAATKAAQLGLSFFHATTENYMALANMGPRGWARAFMADRDSAEFLRAERELIRDGGTTSIQGSTVEAYKAQQPGSIPTYQDIWRKAPAVKQMDEAAQAISDFTFNNLQRRFKVTDYMLHKAAWMAEHPDAMQGEIRDAGRGIAKEVNAIYGGLHWENIGVNKATVEVARAVFLAPDWTISNIFNVKYAFEKGPAGSMARMFWVRTLVGGMVATQAASLMFSRGHFSKRPTMVYMGKDSNGEDVYQNIFFKGAPGDATNLVTNIYDYGLEGLARTVAGKGSPTVRTALQLATNRDYLGHEIAPKGMNPVASSARTAWATAKSLAPIPLSLSNQADMLFGPEAHKYTWPESLTTMFSGNPPSHVPPAGTHMTPRGLRPNAPHEENSAIDQMETGRVYRSRSGR